VSLQTLYIFQYDQYYHYMPLILLPCCALFLADCLPQFSMSPQCRYSFLGKYEINHQVMPDLYQDKELLVVFLNPFFDSLPWRACSYPMFCWHIIRHLWPAHLMSRCSFSICFTTPSWSNELVKMFLTIYLCDIADVIFQRLSVMDVDDII
jgi:hypothetical protein